MPPLLINIFSTHYFLWFAALTSIYGYISVYAGHYANASSSQYGLLNMVLPFITIVAKLYFCSLADRYRAHRSFFIWFLIASLIGFGSFGVLPFFVTPQPKEKGLNYGIWILICLMTGISIVSMGVISCLSDAFAMNSSIKSNSSYGLIRVWGTLGWGVSSLLLAFINQTDKLPLLVPGLIVTIILIAIDILANIFWPNHSDYNLDRSCSDVNFGEVSTGRLEERADSVRANVATRLTTAEAGHNETVSSYGTARKTEGTNNSIEQGSPRPKVSSAKIQWILFKEVARRRQSLFRYMILFTISGALISLQWSYFFLYLEKIYPADFTFISGLSMVVQSMLGELPFFILSKLIIQNLGRSHTLSISIISIGFRYLLYQYLLPNSSMYYVFLTETFQGPNFGLFYVVMTEVGLDYSDCKGAIDKVIEDGVVANNAEEIETLRQSLRATMQSLMSACYEGLGLGIGSIIGGIVIDQYGFNNLWIWAAVTAIVLGLANFLIETLGLPVLVDKRVLVRTI